NPERIDSAETLKGNPECGFVLVAHDERVGSASGPCSAQHPVKIRSAISVKRNCERVTVGRDRHLASLTKRACKRFGAFTVGKGSSGHIRTRCAQDVLVRRVRGKSLECARCVWLALRRKSERRQ